PGSVRYRAPTVEPVPFWTASFASIFPPKNRSAPFWYSASRWYTSVAVSIRTMYWILAFVSVDEAALYAARSLPICVGEGFARFTVAVSLVLVLLIDAPSRSSEGR